MGWGTAKVSEVTDFIALDVETANADFASICSIGFVHFRSGAVFKSLTILVDPEDEFDALNIRNSRNPVQKTSPGSQRWRRSFLR